MTRARTVLAAAAAGLLMPLLPFGPAGPAHAATTQYWYGTVTKIADGDTIYVDIDDDGTGPVPIRNAGLQATELHGENGLPECRALAAQALVARLDPVGSRVRLAADDPSTSGTDAAGLTRLVRYVDAFDPATGRYDVDTQLGVLSAGLGMWGPSPENARVTAFHLATRQAAVAGRGLFDPAGCGGASSGPALSAWMHYDADGDDARLNGEWMRVQNRSDSAVSLQGWALRDQSHTFYRGGTYYRFPAGSSIPAHGVITVYPGTGTDSPATGRFYLGHTTGNVFPNLGDPSLGYPGRSTYLLDPEGDFRATADYPCLASCSRPPVHVSAVQYTGPDERVDVQVDRGVTRDVDLSGVEVTNDGWAYEIAPGTVLHPGETLHVYCDRRGAGSRLEQPWDRAGDGTMLEDGGDVVVLRTAQSTVLSTYRWGSAVPAVGPAITDLAAPDASATTAVTGATDPGASVRLRAADGDSSTPDVTATATAVSGGAFSATLDLRSLRDGTVTVTATAYDTAGTAGRAASTTLRKTSSTVTTAAPGALVAVTGTDGRLYSRTLPGGWHGLGGALRSAPAVVSSGGGTWYLGVGTDGNVAVRTAALGFAPLGPQGTLCQSVSAAASGGTLAVACRGGNGRTYVGRTALVAGRLPAPFARWTDLGGAAATGTGPAVGVQGGEFRYVVTDPAGVVRARTDSTDWAAVAGAPACAGAPTVDDRGDVVACADATSALQVRRNAGGGYVRMPSTFRGQVGVSDDADGTTRYYVVGTDSRLYTASQSATGTLSTFSLLGGTGAQSGGLAALDPAA